MARSMQQLDQARTVSALQSAGPGLWPLPGSRALHAAHSGSTGQVPGGGRPLHTLSPGRQGDIHSLRAQTSIMTASHATAQRINNIVVSKLFHSQQPLSTVPCATVANGQPILPYRGMSIIITENHNKGCRIVKGKDASLVHGHGTMLVVEFPDNERTFIPPVTHAVDGEGDMTTYPFMLAYARTICKSQGQNLKHLFLWLN